MNIQIPNLDTSKIKKIQPLTSYVHKDGTNYLVADLIEHGFNMSDIATLTYEDYCILSDNFLLNEEQMRIAKKLYPTLASYDLSAWTNRDLIQYYTNVDRQNFLLNLTDKQKAFFESKNIKIHDIFYLLKEFNSVDNILIQSDAQLKRVIESYYQFKVAHILSLAEFQAIMEKKSSLLGILICKQAYAAMDSTKYTSQNMPMYGTDYFLNSVVTSSYWLNMQANRTLDMINAIYDIDLSTFSGYVTNMYGTYSVSADGAHEGIDFAYGSSNTDLHAIFDGVVKKYSPSYHFSVYDSSVSKTYTYYHNNSVESSFCTLNTVVDVGDHVTNQGNLGGTSTGVHLHFEVHSGNTTSLSPGNDDVLSSISPYQMNIYIP